MDSESIEDSDMNTYIKESMLSLENACESVKNTTNRTANDAMDNMKKFAVFKNLLIISIAFMLQFSSFNSFVNLQSSLNNAEGLGTTGLALLYVVMFLTSLMLTPLTMSRCSNKWIMVVSMGTYVVYVASGFYPTWSTVIPASVIIGMGAGHLWPAMQSYLTDLATRYARMTVTNVQDKVHLFLGIFFAFTYTSNIWGNLFSSLVFQRTQLNITQNDIETLCGPSFCPHKETNESMNIPPSQKQIYIYTGFCVGITLIAISLTTLATNVSSSGRAATNVSTGGRAATNVSSGGGAATSVSKKLRAVTVHLLTSRNQWLLVFPTLFGGVSDGFVVSDFTSAYISCPYGVNHVGFVMITFGISQCVFSALFGKLNQNIGHIAIYVFGFAAQLSAYITLLLWSPNEFEYTVVYVIAGLFGIGSAVNTPLVLALYNLYFDKDKDVPLSSFRVLNSVGWAISFGYSNWICTQYKLYILLCVLVLALVTVIRLDILYRRDKSNAP